MDDPAYTVIHPSSPPHPFTGRALPPPPPPNMFFIYSIYTTEEEGAHDPVSFPPKKKCESIGLNGEQKVMRADFHTEHTQTRVDVHRSSFGTE